jgi:hypothetical protein
MACIENNNKAEAIRYIERVSKEEQVSVHYINTFSTFTTVKLQTPDHLEIVVLTKTTGIYFSET